MKVGLLFCALLLTGCALSETELKTEAKVRFDKVYPVELAHYEYEERLQTFYDAEEILPEHLGRLYRGEFPNGETSPNKLRIHWTNARALAQAEVELQKDILGWAGADVSPRPILINDRADKFYRYYEYRVLMGGKEVGAVRIPAYRRTENFATAEVHQYNGDASQYTILPSMWSLKVIQNTTSDSNDNFIQKIYNEIYANLNEDALVAYGIQQLQKHSNQLPQYKISTTGISDTIKKDLDDTYNTDPWVLELIGRIKNNDDFFQVSKQKEVESELPQVSQSFRETLYRSAAYITAKSMVDDTRQLLAESSSVYYNLLYSLVFQGTWLSMSVEPINSNSLSKILKNEYWNILDENIQNGNILNIFTHKWNISKIRSDNSIIPILEFPPYKKSLRTDSLEVVADNITPDLSLYIRAQDIIIPITRPVKKSFSARFRFTGSREEAIELLSLELQLQFRDAAKSVVSVYDPWESTQIFFKEAFVGSSAGAGVTKGVIKGVELIAKWAKTPFVTPEPISMGITIAVQAICGLTTGILKVMDTYSQKTKEEMEKQFNEMEKFMGDGSSGLSYKVNQINQYLISKGEAPLSSADGPDIAYILKYNSTSSKAVRKELFYNRLYRAMAIRANGWTLTGPLFIHESWSTGSFVPVPDWAIRDRGAYAHRIGDLSKNPKE